MPESSATVDLRQPAETVAQENGFTLAALEQRLRSGEPARSDLPGGGRLYVERPLRFICLTRSSGASGRALERQVAAQAGYVIAGAETSAPLVQELVRRLQAQRGEHHSGPYLVIELWEEGAAGEEEALPRPAFGIASAGDDASRETATALEKGLAEVRLGPRQATVEQFGEESLRRRVARSLAGGLAETLPDLAWLGIAVRPVYASANGLVFPRVLMQLTEQLTTAIQKAAFAFTCRYTPDKPPHHQALGSRELLPAALTVDRRLAKVSRSFDFLRLITPLDIDRAWHEFEQAGEASPPEFHYRPLPVDPEAIKRALFNVPIEEVEDPTLARLFRAKQEELDRKITMLRERGRRSFFYLSLQQYGEVEPWLSEQATAILAAIPPQTRERRQRSVDSRQMAARIEDEIECYRQRWDGFEARVEVVDDLASALLVEKDHILVARDAEFTPEPAEALVHHEVGTHLVTYCNALAQPLSLVCGGLPGYDSLQEGLAVLGEYLAGGLDRARLRLLAARVVVCEALCDGASFVEAYRGLVDEHGYSEHRAFSIALRVYRSGGLTKDAVYLRGFHQLLSYLGAGGEIEALLVGKVGFDHLPEVQELRRRNILEAPRLEPRYFELPGADARLGRCREGLSLTELMETER